MVQIRFRPEVPFISGAALLCLLKFQRNDHLHVHRPFSTVDVRVLESSEFKGEKYLNCATGDARDMVSRCLSSRR